jgi:sugar phosphate isomerase/epimerase
MYKLLSTRELHVSGRQSELIELALSYGFKGLDLDLAEFQQDVASRGLPAARRLLDSARLKLDLFRLPLEWAEDEEFKAGMTKLPEWGKLAADLGAKRAITTIAPANDSIPYHENFEFHRRRLAEVGEALAPYGINLGVEFVPTVDARRNRAFQFIHGFDAVVALVGMLRSANVGALVDLWAIHAAGNSLDDARKLTPDRITAVLVSDAPAGVPGGSLSAEQRLLPGETGVLDLAAALSWLAEIGYAGPIVAAVHPAATRGLGREQLVKRAAERIDAAWKAAGISPAGKLLAAVKK